MYNEEQAEANLSTYQRVKLEVARAINDNIHTKRWHYIVEYTVLALIFLSTLEIFFSTFEKISAKYEHFLHAIDIITTIAFTIEVTLRLWTIGLSDERYKGFLGKIRYAFSLYGFIDICSTYPFWINFIIPVPYGIMKVMRVVRLLRIFRYIKSFRILVKAVESKQKEMIISFQFLLVVTVILCFFFYFYEHEAQPEVFANIFDAFNWAFTKYLGDPGKLADVEVVSLPAKIISYLVGALGIAIVAVPAGLLGSAFLEVIEQDEHEEKIKKDSQTMRYAFKQKQCRFTKFIRVPNNVSVTDMQAEHNLDLKEVMDVIEAYPTRFRLRNLAKSRPVEERPEDKLVVETFPFNRKYGCFIDRGSKVTIVGTSNNAETAIGPFSYYLAKIGGFNYVSKEIDMNPHYTTSYYTVKNQHANEHLEAFIDDLKSLNRGEDNWFIFLISSCGGEEPLYPTQFHYVCCGKKGDENIEGPDISVIDRDLFRKAFANISETIEKEYDLTSDCQRFHSTPNPANKIETIVGGGKTCNAFTLRVNWSVSCWDMRHIAIAKTIADKFNEFFEPGVEKTYSEELTKRVNEADYGYDFYKDQQEQL